MCFASAQHKKHTTLNQCVILKQKMYYILQTHNRKEEKKKHGDAALSWSRSKYEVIIVRQHII